ncbi:Late embryogenesis abundant (LEA) hydroxyproline-rich glycoprotein family [Forsythia ovata]|uniref:Late embryogenesis abundant (LEA) hydroxyproline-rich glycoprotein family n=1 Tax=Forsythia ovata TaxID=205694 RepID=A0ABD1S4Z5_9LAMI
MPPLPPPPPFIPPHQKQFKQSPLHQIVLSKQALSQQTLTPEVLHNSKSRSTEQPILKEPRRTNPIIWCGAILCMIFSLFLIFFGIATLVLFLDVKPRIPVFDTPAATLNVIYFNSPDFLNGDVIFLANFSNPNRKLNVKYEYLDIELFFSETLIAAQALQSFSQNPGETRLMSVHLISSLVHLPPSIVLELQKQVQRNRVAYDLRGTFRVKVKLGNFHYSYWLHGRCKLEMTSPPTGALITHSCRTKR